MSASYEELIGRLDGATLAAAARNASPAALDREWESWLELNEAAHCTPRDMFEAGFEACADAIREAAACRVCGCSDLDCSGCVERTGKPCHWVEDNLCSACAEESPRNG
jgi:hypothetical protein